MNILRNLDVEIDSSNIADCHWLLSKGPMRVIIKFSKRKFANKIRHCKRNLKRMNLASLGICSPAFINGQYYNMVWRKCKKPFTKKFIDSFWISNGSIRLRIEDKDNPCVITHITDLEDLFPSNDLLRDEE